MVSDNSANIQLAVDRELLVTVVQIEESGFSEKLKPLVHDMTEMLYTLEKNKKLKWSSIITRSDTKLEYTESILTFLKNTRVIEEDGNYWKIADQPED